MSKRIRKYFSYAVIEGTPNRDENTFHAFDGNLINTYRTLPTGETFKIGTHCIRSHTAISDVFIRNAHPKSSSGHCLVETKGTEPGHEHTKSTKFQVDNHFILFLNTLIKTRHLQREREAGKIFPLLRVVFEDDCRYPSL
ncbi:MAG TPA: hypothetical protein DEA55_11960 [Rhodospirillaceae bacterium]|nr:hypothetical protein [Rhodospirillaceae bacterium]